MQELEELENQYWIVDPRTVAWYQGHSDQLALEYFSPVANDNMESELISPEINTAKRRYALGEISAEEMLRVFDEKVRMMLLEGN